ncbi:MAG: GAF domain-containing protein [Beijerinckiaceae bacterium]
MVDNVSAPPAFGQADLTNCEREQIHLAGSIQPHGAILVVNEDDCTILQASANAGVFLRLDGAVVGRRLQDISADLCERIEQRLESSIAHVPVGIRFSRAHDQLYDATIHRPPAGGLIVEIEQAGENVDLAGRIEPLLKRITGSPTLRSHCDETARVVRELTGYDRVMVYRFDKQGHGEVLSEDRRSDLESYLGNWYPASDIPQIARRLYERNRIRVLVDVTYKPVPIEPRASPLTGEELDMSLCILRSSSPIHVQYLRNMGVAATLVISLMVHGRLWGLIACHHYGPKSVPFEYRAVCEVVAEAVATRIAALETFAQARAEMSARRLEQRMIEAISREGDWRNALFETPQTLLQARATGAALVYDGQVQSTGEAPSTLDIRAMAAWIRDQQPGPAFFSARFTAEAPSFRHLTPIASGVAARRVSDSGDDWLMWFRPERIRTVTWGGDPSKPVEIGNSPADLSPRRSFAQWHQLVVGTAEDWTSDDVAATRLIGEVVADVALQHQSVRSLIIHDQIRQVNRTISVSGHPVATADAGGDIAYTNASYDRLVSGRIKPKNIRQFAKLLIRPPDMAERLNDLVEDHRGWRGEVWMMGKDGDEIPLMLRADAVVAPDARVLGFVLLFTDLTEVKAAEAARRRFQNGLVESYAMKHARLDTESDLVYRRLLSSIVENAQIAALEIAESEHVAGIPSMLDSVRDSVARSAEVLETLVSHAMRSTAANKVESGKENPVRRKAGARKPGTRSKRKY